MGYGVARDPLDRPYVGEPEGNAVAERFTRTLKEACLYLHARPSTA